MGNIDKCDMLLSSIECERKTMKWYNKIFMHLVDLCFLNSYSAYKTVSGKKIPIANFQLELIRQILDNMESAIKVPIEEEQVQMMSQLD